MHLTPYLIESITLASGSATFTSPLISTTDVVFINRTASTNPGHVSYSISGTTITFTSSSATDASVLSVIIFRNEITPNPKGPAAVPTAH